MKRNLYKKFLFYSIQTESHIKYLQLQETKLQINILKIRIEVKDQNIESQMGRKVEKNEVEHLSVEFFNFKSRFLYFALGSSCFKDFPKFALSSS